MVSLRTTCGYRPKKHLFFFLREKSSCLVVISVTHTIYRIERERERERERQRQRERDRDRERKKTERL